MKSLAVALLITVACAQSQDPKPLVLQGPTSIRSLRGYFLEDVRMLVDGRTRYTAFLLRKKADWQEEAARICRELGAHPYRSDNLISIKLVHGTQRISLMVSASDSQPGTLSDDLKLASRGDFSRVMLTIREISTSK